MSLDVRYNPKIPENTSDKFSTSQPDLQKNFQTIYDSFAKNHVALDAVSGAGNHSVIELIQQDNSPQTNVSEISVYAKPVNYGAAEDDKSNQIFLKYQDNKTEIQLTNYQIYNVDSNNFFSFLPGRVLLYFGNFPANTSRLNLVPAIAKTVISAAVCPIGTTGDYKPNVSLMAAENGFYKAFTVTTAVVGLPVPACYYFVVANI